jgi:hypothetical protein
MEALIGVGMRKVISNQNHNIGITRGTVCNHVDIVDHLDNSKFTIIILQSLIVLNGSIIIKVFVAFEAFWISVSL